MTVPEPAPAFPTLKVCEGAELSLNVAVQALSPSIVTWPSAQSASPLHPANIDPAAAVGIRLTTAPSAYIAEQSTPQLIPAGSEVTVPLPLPARFTVSVKSSPGPGSGPGSGPGPGSSVSVPPVIAMLIASSTASGPSGHGLEIRPATQLTPAAVTGPEYRRCSIQPLGVIPVSVPSKLPAVRNDAPVNVPATSPSSGVGI